MGLLIDGAWHDQWYDTKRSGGRWNGKGTAVVYTSATLSLALLETLVHLPSGMLPAFSAVPADVAVPKGAGPHPVLVYLHGGGWVAGSPRTHHKLGRRFAELQFLAAWQKRCVLWDKPKLVDASLLTARLGHPADHAP